MATWAIAVACARLQAAHTGEPPAADAIEQPAVTERILGHLGRAAGAVDPARS